MFSVLIRPMVGLNAFRVGAMVLSFRPTSLKPCSRAAWVTNVAQSMFWLSIVEFPITKQA